MEDQTEVIEAGEDLVGPQRTQGVIVNVAMKNIPATENREAFKLLELEIGKIHGPVREVLGSTNLKVGLTCNKVTPRNRLGQLAAALIGWQPKTPLRYQELKGKSVEFWAEAKQTEKGTFWEVNRESLGPVGHLENIPAVPATP